MAQISFLNLRKSQSEVTTALQPFFGIWFKWENPFQIWMGDQKSISPLWNKPNDKRQSSTPHSLPYRVQLFKHSNQRWKGAPVRSSISQDESQVAGRIENSIENSWGDLWGRQWFRTIPTEFYGKLGKDSDSFEAWRYLQSLSPSVKLG